MADQKISQLTALTTQASADELVIVDSSATQTKKITVNNLFQGIPVDVGIGTSSPAYRLGVATTATNIANFDTTGTTAGLITFSDANTAASNTVRLGSIGNNLAFYTNTTGAGTERMRIDSSGNVGIGTSSPSATLEVVSSSSGGAPVFSASGTDHVSAIVGTTGGGFSTATGNYFSIWHQPYADRGTQNNLTERMRIDSSGNVLVGKTSAAVGTDGAQFLPSGYSGVSATSTTAFFANRNTADGDVVEIGKNGVKVGSIGTSSSVLYLGSGDTGVRFIPSFDSIEPYNTSTQANRDAALTLGRATNRFSDLYLSGGVYLGGTATANKLDDYEEGTWTPTYTPEGGSFTTMSLTAVTAAYTKIGDTVIAMCYVRTSDVDVTGASGAVYLGGLPFTINGYFQASIGNTFGWAGEHPDGGFGSTGNNYVSLRYRSSVTSDSTNVDVSDLTTGTTANQNQVIMTFIYKTSA